MGWLDRVKGKLIDDYLPRINLTSNNTFRRAMAERDRAVAELARVTGDSEETLGALPPFLEASVEMSPADLGDAYAELDDLLASYETPGPDEEEDRLYLAFELVLRGAEARIARQQALYMPHLAIPEQNRQCPVLDIGCGRGEFLALLHNRGIRCVGVDANPIHVRQLNERGLEAHHGDALEYLAGLADASLAAITGFQVVEHVSPEYLRELLRCAYAKLADGGNILLETVNTYCLETFRWYYVDPTHRQPVPKDLLAILLKFYGFRELRAFYQNPIPPPGVPADRDRPLYYITYALLGRKTPGDGHRSR